MTTTTFKLIALLLVAVCVFSSCASIVSKSSYPVFINSDPADASIVITDKKNKEVYIGKSPATVVLPASAGYFSKAEYQVSISAPGYSSIMLPIRFKLDGWYFGNIVFGGLIGMLVVDPATGAMWKIENEIIDVVLQQITASADGSNADNQAILKIVDINNIPDEIKDKLVRVQ